MTDCHPPPLLCGQSQRSEEGIDCSCWPCQSCVRRRKCRVSGRSCLRQTLQNRIQNSFSTLVHVATSSTKSAAALLLHFLTSSFTCKPCTVTERSETAKVLPSLPAFQPKYNIAARCSCQDAVCRCPYEWALQRRTEKESKVLSERSFRLHVPPVAAARLHCLRPATFASRPWLITCLTTTLTGTTPLSATDAVSLANLLDAALHAVTLVWCCGHGLVLNYTDLEKN